MSGRCRLQTQLPKCRPTQTSARRSFSASANLRGYDDTIKNLKIGKETRVIFQGFTGRQATSNAQESIAWGTKIVGGVTPNKEGEHLGLPVLPSVKRAMEELKPDATGIYVAAHQAPAAIEEAIAAEVPLIVAVAEHIPLHDILRIHSILSTQSKSRLVGANAPGIISAIGHCRIGFQPIPTFSPGHIGVCAKSGTLSYETVASLTRAGLGQSLCIGMGGDVVAGTNFIDALKVFEDDPDTEAIVLVGEVGGTAEEEAAEWIKDYRRRSKNPKPIAALVGGLCAKQGRVMGHAGAWADRGQTNAKAKWKALESVGVTMVNHPAKFGSAMKSLLSKVSQNGNTFKRSDTASLGKRGYHTHHRPGKTQSNVLHTALNRRSLHLSRDQSAALLKEYKITASPSAEESRDSRFLGISIDRTARRPCIIASPTTSDSAMHSRAVRIPFDYRQGPTNQDIKTAVEHLQMDASPQAAMTATVNLIKQLWQLFKAKEAVSLYTHITVPSTSDQLKIDNLDFTFDDAAFKSTKRQSEIHKLRDTSLEDPVELSAEPDGIVYMKLDGPERNIGTLVNGAGLAMNTVDALAAHGGLAANFLDTGGKATSETVKRSFELILQDPRVTVIFVNIFGGLTLGDMIARGILLAFKELDVGSKVPVVVRIRGTNEKEGQKIIADSGLELYAFDDFEEAAEKVVELANQRSK